MRPELVAWVLDVATALDDMAPRFLLVGGCAPAMFEWDDAVTSIRPTTDVDLAVHVTRYTDYSDVQRELRRRAFTDPPPDRALLCRLMLGDIAVDVMPTRPVTGPTNPWYEPALANRVPSPRALPNGLCVIDPVHFVATKLVAFEDRGKGDYMASHDLEDVISCLRAVPGLPEVIAAGRTSVAAFARQRIALLTRTPAFVGALPAHFEPDGATQETVPAFVERLRKLAR